MDDYRQLFESQVEALQQHPEYSSIPRFLGDIRELSSEKQDELILYLRNPICIEEKVEFADGTFSTGIRYAVMPIGNPVEVRGRNPFVHIIGIDSDSSGNIPFEALVNGHYISEYEKVDSKIVCTYLGRVDDLDPPRWENFQQAIESQIKQVKGEF